MTLRLVSVNAPEGDECWGPEARAALDSLVGTDPFTVEVVGEDQFGRALARVSVGDSDVNRRLVEEGMAIATTADSGDDFGESVVEAEEGAYQAGAGLWSQTACGETRPMPQISIDPRRSVVDPAGPDDEDLAAETIVLVNEGDQRVQLGGWVLRDESSRHRYTFDPATALDPGGSLVVTSADSGWDPGGGPVWNNGGDMALLQTPGGTVVDRWRY